jgi:hypothetical protein
MSRKGNNNDEMEEEAFRRVKRERLNANDNAPEDHQDSSSRRIIRSEFLKLKSLINGIFPFLSLYLFLLLSSFLNNKYKLTLVIHSGEQRKRMI